ncbi:UBX domain-containing protein 1 isoform X2 [Anomaloglossus baeobatrachus]|uniref:UBX domain-containing protein 1 isoform X2 n=1 Tax=Anomaloglossus baeobatrachus TaxID=238106 RepID=UPI003F508E3F
MSECSALESLIEMGFPPSRAEKAVAATGNQGIESAMDWLMEHEDDPDIDEPNVLDTKEDTSGQDPQEMDTGSLETDASLERASLTEEEKERQTRRERVKEKIARDKAERARKYGGSTSDPISPPAESPLAAPTPSPSSPVQEPPTKKEYDECRIQVRLLDGTALSQTFRAREQLAAVRLYVELNWPGGPEGPFNLLTSFPRRVFTEEDMEKPLQELGLVPSAVLIVAKK